ncbi:carbamate kinase [Candidatus Woesearchaeota archaeon]|nr:carbamate kinase [Candidatus Woesearchaeota archaeon]
MKIIIALGGNAIIKKGEKETYHTLIKNIKLMSKNIAPIVKKYNAVITHGNGYEIGNLLLQNEISSKKVPPMPLDILGAESQGLIGYPLEEQLINELRNTKKEIVTVLTQVLVDEKDKAFRNPTKFIGPFYSYLEYKRLRRRYKIRKDSNRGYRRIVPSPKPVRILEAKTIEFLIKRGNVVICGGGGGIPIVNKKGKLKGVEGVIDKDWASSCIGKSINADILLILTGVDKVSLNYGEKNEIKLDKMSVKRAKRYLKEGYFPAGSMGPKIEASIDFLKKGKKVIITDVEHALKSLEGKAGTLITKR